MENVEGRRCDKCKENKRDRQMDCINCPSCYNLVQDAVGEHRKNLRHLENVLKDIKNNPTVVNDEEFDKKLKAVQAAVDELERNAKDATGGEYNILFYLTTSHNQRPWSFVQFYLYYAMLLCCVGNVPTSDRLEALESQIREIKDLMNHTNVWTAQAEETAISHHEYRKIERRNR